MAKLFKTPISTSNLYAPDIERLWKTFAESVSETGELEVGKLTGNLESQLCQYHQSEYCVTFSTGFWALVAAARIKALPNRSEIIIPSMTYRRLADVVFWSGHTPVMVDVEPENLAICPRAVEQEITPNTALILGVHPIVNCCDVNRLIETARRHQVPIIFDAVESVHETLASRRVGSFGVGEVFSLHASKLINGLEGGYVCTDDVSLRNALQSFRKDHSMVPSKLNHETTSESSPSDSMKAASYDINRIGGINGVLNDVHAAFAIAGLEEIASNVAHNERIYRAYVEYLDAVDGIDLLRFDESEQSSFKNIVVDVARQFPLTRDQLVQRLNQEGILARPHYSPALHCKQYDYPVRVGSMKVAEIAMLQYLNLPCGSRVTLADVQIVCKFIAKLASS